MYTVERQIGHGGMGCVFKAHAPDGRCVALKMMSNKVTCYPEYRQLFQSEVETLRRMDHPSVVHIVGDPYSDKEGNLYLPMEFIDGETIEQRVNKCGVFSMEQAVDLMCKILDALQYVHNCNRIHRDIKPSNIMIKPDGNICVIDFGIAKDAKIGSGHTVGRIIGTDGYMSPEQANGLNIDRRTDIYSLGCVLFYLLTGQHAIQKGKNDYETVCNILRNIPALPSKITTGVSSALDSVFAKSVDKDMTKRYQTASEFKDALEDAVGKSLPKVTIGRQESVNDIVIMHHDVSRRHLTIKGIEQAVTGGTNKYVVEIIDVGSTNGTGIDGRLLRNASERFDFHGTERLPVVLLAGKPELAVDWKEVVRRLQDKGWKPQTRPVVPPSPSPPKEKDLNFFLCIMSFLVPFVGWSVWAVLRDDHPKKAVTAAGYAWGGFVLILIACIIYFSFRN